MEKKLGPKVMTEFAVLRPKRVTTEQMIMMKMRSKRHKKVDHKTKT